jgi:hypothetical protein
MRQHRVCHYENWNAHITIDPLAPVPTLDRNLKAFFTLMGISDLKT